jgi:hypothetical protein
MGKSRGRVREGQAAHPRRARDTRAEFEAIAVRAGPQFQGVLETMIAHWRELEAKARE